MLEKKLDKVLRMTVASLATLGVLGLGGCAQDLSSGYYQEGHVGEAMTTRIGVITQARPVTISPSAKLQDQTTGLIAGGVAGGLLGSTAGKGRGRTLATGAGAGLGALGGAALQRHLATQQGMEYTVQMEDNNELLTVVQTGPQFGVNQRVKVIISHQGRSRVVPY